MKNKIKRDNSFSLKRVIITILLISVSVILVIIFTFRILFTDRQSMGTNKPNKRGNAFLGSLTGQVNDRARLAAESHGAIWFSALRANNKDKLLQPLSIRYDQTAEVEHIKLIPYMGQGWTVEFPAKNIADCGEGCISYLYTLSAIGISKDGTSTRIRIEINGDVESYESSRISWSANPL